MKKEKTKTIREAILEKFVIKECFELYRYSYYDWVNSVYDKVRASRVNVLNGNKENTIEHIKEEFNNLFSEMTNLNNYEVEFLPETSQIVLITCCEKYPLLELDFTKNNYSDLLAPLTVTLKGKTYNAKKVSMFFVVNQILTMINENMTAKEKDREKRLKKELAECQKQIAKLEKCSQSLEKDRINYLREMEKYKDKK